MGHEVLEGELILKEVFGKANLPEGQALGEIETKDFNFSVVLNTF